MLRDQHPGFSTSLVVIPCAPTGWSLSFPGVPAKIAKHIHLMMIDVKYAESFWGCDFLGRTCPKSQRVVVPEASQLSSFTMVSLLDSKRDMLCQGCAYGRPRLWRGTLKAELLSYFHSDSASKVIEFWNGSMFIWHWCICPSIYEGTYQDAGHFCV